MLHICSTVVMRIVSMVRFDNSIVYAITGEACQLSRRFAS